jgi:hypothetical protein
MSNLISPTSLPLFGALLLGMAGCKGCNSENNLVNVAADTGEEAFTNDWGSWLSMDAMADGSPAIAYYDATQTGVGFAIADVRDDGTVRWEREQVDGYPVSGLDNGERGRFAAMTIAADDTVWVFYQDVGLGTLRYGKRDPATGEWTTDLADVGGGPSSDAGYFASASLDSSGRPVVVHYDKGKKNLRIVRLIGEVFTGEVLAEGDAYDPGDGEGEIAADVGEFSTIVVSGGIEYVAYYDRTWGDLKLSWGTPGAHTVETVDDVGDVGQWPDVLIDSGTIHISYHDTTNQDLRYAYGEPGSWTSDAIDQDPYVGADSAIFLEDGSVSIAYFDGRNNDMKLAWQDGGGWSVDMVTGSEGALGFHNEVITSSKGTFAACYDYPNRTLWFSAL